MDISLIGKRALVSASADGIGKACAMALSRLGAEVVLVDFNAGQLPKTLEELDRSHNQGHDFIIADYTEPELLKEKISGYLQGKPPIHILVNNSGGPPPCPILDADLADFQRPIQMHLFCNQVLVQALLEGMKKDGYGRIVNILSISIKQIQPNLGVSNTIRGAVAQWAKTLAVELGKFNITVNNVLPSMARTNRFEAGKTAIAKQTGITPEEQEKKWVAPVPLQRVGTPQEIANAVVFLASPAASYISGINLPVDGGYAGSL